jgi:DNA-binding MarR family transcriptional regulator
MLQPTTSQLERARALLAEAAGDSANTQVAVGVIQLLMTAKRVGPGQHEQATVSAMLSKLALQGPMRSADLSHYLQLDPSTVSRHINSMLDGGFVAKTTDDHDRRVQWIQITDTGRARLHARMNERITQIEKVTDGWSEADRELFSALLSRFVTDFDRTINETDSEAERA